MIRSIEIERYRGFERYKFGNLSRVNLLVGKNNCGKTAVLEAVHLLASSGNPRVLDNIATRRGETIFSSEDRRTYSDISHFFYGHALEPNVSFVLRGDNEIGGFRVRIASLSEVTEQQDLFSVASDIQPDFALIVESLRRGASPVQPVVPVSAKGALSMERLRRLISRIEGQAATQFISANSLETRSMSNIWDDVILEAREPDVLRAMQILEPGLTGIYFLSSDPTYPLPSSSGVVLGLEGSNRRVPLGSFGDGMRRLLALSISLIRAKGGVLMVDEIDTGLHYSIMGDLWQLVVRAAVEFQLQVFATTHSFDCIRGLAWLCENHPDLMAQVSVHKIERGLESSVPVSGERLRIALEQEFELR